MIGVLFIATLLGGFLGVLWLGSRIEPRGAGEPSRGDGVVPDWPLFPFGRQPVEPIDAEQIRVGRPF